MNRNITIMLALLIVALIGWGAEYWDRTSDTAFDVYTDTLGLVLGTNTRDSTGVIPGHTNYMVSMFPGQTAKDSFAYAPDSTIVFVIMRGWADKQRTNLMWQKIVFNPFKMKRRPWLRISPPQGTTNADNSDSATALYTTDRTTELFQAAWGVGTGTWDSTRIDLVKIINEVHALRAKEFAPWVDIVVDDSLVCKGRTATPGWKGLVTVTGWNN